MTKRCSGNLRIPVNQNGEAIQNGLSRAGGSGKRAFQAGWLVIARCQVRALLVIDLFEDVLDGVPDPVRSGRSKPDRLTRLNSTMHSMVSLG